MVKSLIMQRLEPSEMVAVELVLLFTACRLEDSQQLSALAAWLPFRLLLTS